MKCALIITFCVAATLVPARSASADTIIYHELKVDASGRIVPWYGKGASEAYDHVVRLVWNFWKNIRNCPNGVPLYMQHQVWEAAKDDPRGLGGDQIPMALSSWNLLYGYLALQTNKWGPFFEDIPTADWSGTEINADTLAMYIIQHPDWDANWKEQAGNRYPRDANWLTDGYGDYVRHYLRAMAAAPELAPEDQNHLLRTSSVIQNIAYAPDRIRYRKFDARSTERFKLAAWTPKSVRGGTMTWDDGTRVLTVTASSPDVTITR